MQRFHPRRTGLPKASAKTSTTTLTYPQQPSSTPPRKAVNAMVVANARRVRRTCWTLLLATTGHRRQPIAQLPAISWDSLGGKPRLYRRRSLVLAIRTRRRRSPRPTTAWLLPSIEWMVKGRTGRWSTSGPAVGVACGPRERGEWNDLISDCGSVGPSIRLLFSTVNL